VQPFLKFDLLYLCAIAINQVLISSFSHSGTLVLDMSWTLSAGGSGAIVLTKIHALFPQHTKSASTTDGPENLIKMHKIV